MLQRATLEKTINVDNDGPFLGVRMHILRYLRENVPSIFEGQHHGPAMNHFNFGQFEALRT